MTTTASTIVHDLAGRLSNLKGLSAAIKKLNLNPDIMALLPSFPGAILSLNKICEIADRDSNYISEYLQALAKKEIEEAAKPEPIDWFRPDNDSNGNPRYVCHFLEFITDKDREQAGYNISDGYNIALARAKKLGGHKFHNKKYGGGIVFQSYNISTTEKDIQELMKQYL